MHAPWIFHPLVISKPKHFRLISQRAGKTEIEGVHVCVCVCAHVCMHVSTSVHVPVSFVSLQQAHRVTVLKVTITVLSVSKVTPVAAPWLFLWTRMKLFSHLWLVSPMPVYFNHQAFTVLSLFNSTFG